MRVRNVVCAAATCSGLAVIAGAAPTLDGSIAGDGYGLPFAVQTVNTEFGDNASELNAAYAQIDGGVLYLALTGNLENNFNKLNIFIDSVAGGQNTLTADANNGGTNPENDNWANEHAGMTFDTGFDADYMLIARNGNAFGDTFDLDFATVGGGLGAFESASGIFGGTLTGSNANALVGAGIGVAFDNSNAAGVGAGSGAADPVAAMAVMTGLEFAIPLSAIGSPTGAFKISAMVNGSNHDFLSNQILGGLQAPQGNLGGDGNGNFIDNLSGIDLNSFGGDQFFVVPTPGTIALFGVAGLAMRRRR